MIKENTKKTLVWLYPTSEDWRWLTKTQIQLVVPNLTPAGLRSLLYSLEKKQLVLTRRQMGEVQYGLTTIGKATIAAEIPALKAATWGNSAHYSLLVFLKSPPNDRNFRYLRQFLLQHHWVGISRGVFLFPDQPTETVLTVIQKLYARSVAILRVGDWVWGDARLLIGQQSASNLADELYSGISREVEGLIGQLLDQKEFDDQSKSKFHSVFNRLYSALAQDSSLVAAAESSRPTGQAILGRLQLLG